MRKLENFGRQNSNQGIYRKIISISNLSVTYKRKVVTNDIQTKQINVNQNALGILVQNIKTLNSEQFNI